MRPSNGAVNKWFTRLRKRLGGPPGFDRLNPRTYVNHGQEIDKGIAIVAFDKAHREESMCLGFLCFVGFRFDMSDHWSYFDSTVKYGGMHLERFAGLDGSLGHYNDNWFFLDAENLDDIEQPCAALYTDQMVPWLDQYHTRDDVLTTIRAELNFARALPFRFDSQRVQEFRIEVGEHLAAHPDRQPDRFTDWLLDKHIVTDDESKAIKMASIQAIDQCTDRIRRIGLSMTEST